MTEINLANLPDHMVRTRMRPHIDRLGLFRLKSGEVLRIRKIGTKSKPLWKMDVLNMRRGSARDEATVTEQHQIVLAFNELNKEV